MQLPLFFHDGPLEPSSGIEPDEVTAKHIFQVLRMQAGEKLMLTDGKGTSAIVNIVKAGKKSGLFEVIKTEKHPAAKARLHLAVAFTKNSGRNEWLMEKAVELGVSSIIPISSERSERERFRFDRWKNIIVSALIQSRQYHLPDLTDITRLESILENYQSLPQKFMGHCIDGMQKQPLVVALHPGKDTIILIGPEGDFTREEAEGADAKGFRGILLGSQRLRTETAAMAVCAYFNLINYEV